jgi:hypothetical protein
MNDSSDSQEQRLASLARISARGRNSRHSPFAIAEVRRHLEGDSLQDAPVSDTQTVIKKLWGAATESAVNWSRVRTSVHVLGRQASTELQRAAIDRLRDAVTLPQLRAAIAALEAAFRPSAALTTATEK